VQQPLVVAQAELPGERGGGTICRDLVVLDLLRRANKGSNTGSLLGSFVRFLQHLGSPAATRMTPWPSELTFRGRWPHSGLMPAAQIA
jgi:hypothetical protein